MQQLYNQAIARQGKQTFLNLRSGSASACMRACTDRLRSSHSASFCSVTATLDIEYERALHLYKIEIIMKQNDHGTRRALQRSFNSRSLRGAPIRRLRTWRGLPEARYTYIYIYIHPFPNRDYTFATLPQTTCVPKCQ